MLKIAPFFKPEENLFTKTNIINSIALNTFPLKARTPEMLKGWLLARQEIMELIENYEEQKKEK